jgi:hypothetical protein
MIKYRHIIFDWTFSEVLNIKKFRKVVLYLHATLSELLDVLNGNHYITMPIWAPHAIMFWHLYEGVSKSFRTCRLEPELQMIQPSATRCSCIAILWDSVVSFAAITLYVAPQWVFIFVIVYFVIDSIRKLLDTPLYNLTDQHQYCN